MPPPLANSRLFEPIQIGSMNLPHRVVMAPLTRYRANDDHIPLPMVRDYYTQRAAVPGTLIIAEATFISPRMSGYRNVPGIWSAEQIAAWKPVTEAVHAKKSFIFLQLWALGRTAIEEVMKEGGLGDVLGASDIGIGHGFAEPRPMSIEEIQGCIDDYVQGSLNAIAAGFDGIEIHGANGYVLDQFAQDISNNRTDKYGGCIENRSRFGVELVTALAEAIGPERVGVRLSPYATFHGMGMADPVPQFTHLISSMAPLNLAYLHLIESYMAPGEIDIAPTESLVFAIDAWGPERPVLIAGGYTAERALAALSKGGRYEAKNVAIVFGRYFTSNPDLVFRLYKGLEFRKYERSKFYTPKKAEGYIDYPVSPEYLQAFAA